MKQSAKIIADSISPAGKRITTFELMLWRPLLAELNTHRALSKSAASSRAVPLAKRVQQVRENCFVPDFWGSERKGMRPGEELGAEVRRELEASWRWAADQACMRALEIHSLGCHKSVPNRILEPFLAVPVVVTGTEWENFFALRCEVGEDGLPISDPHMHQMACMMLEVMRLSQPKQLAYGEWHTPYWGEGACYTTPTHAINISAARCARVSYRLFDGRESTLDEDERLCAQLLRDGHMGPFEHQARPLDSPTGWSGEGVLTGNFKGWVQYRQTLANNVRRFQI